MKDKLVNIICGILITASLIVFTRSLISMYKKNGQSSPQYKSIGNLHKDPLTEGHAQRQYSHKPYC